jgi:hypothetical protein
MSEGIERYDTGRGSPAAGELNGAIDDLVDAIALPASIGSGGGTGYSSFTTAFGDYRNAVTERVQEQQRVGGLVAAMMDGVHRRLGRPSPATMRGRVR